MRKADYSESDLKKALADIGIKKGDNIKYYRDIYPTPVVLHQAYIHDPSP